MTLSLTDPFTTLVNAADKSISANYEYTSFGDTIRATGPFAQINLFRFATKFTDVESGLLYYGYRLYNAGLGRWVNRDPFNALTAKQMAVLWKMALPHTTSGVSDPEFLPSGLNLYCFVGNRPVTSVDPDGQILLDFVMASLEAFSMDSAAVASAWQVGSVATAVISDLATMAAGSIAYFATEIAGAAAVSAGVFLVAHPEIFEYGEDIFSGLMPGPANPSLTGVLTSATSNITGVDIDTIINWIADP